MADSYKKLIAGLEKIGLKGILWECPTVRRGECNADTADSCNCCPDCIELPNIDGAITYLATLTAELDKLKEFARRVISVECWGCYDLDGGEVQDLAESLGLIAEHTATAEEVDEESEFEVGDTIYKFSPILKESETDK